MSRTLKDHPLWMLSLEPGSTQHHDHCAAQVLDGARDQPPYGIGARPGRAWWRSHVPGWYVSLTWDRPSRQRARLNCLEYAKERNGGGADVDVEVDVSQTRHGARWDWD